MEEDPLLTPEHAQPQDELEKPVPLRGLLVRDVLIASANYALLAFVHISFSALQPVFLSTPIEFGGLGLDPAVIGTVVSCFGILIAVFTVLFFSWLTDYFGVKGVYLMGVSAAVPSFALFPVISHLARNSTGGLGVAVWVAVGAQLTLSAMVWLGYGTPFPEEFYRECVQISDAHRSYISGAVFIFIAAAAPNKASLGATNGIAQVLVSITRAVGPAFVNSVYSLSIDKEHHYMNGGLVYYMTVVLSLGAVWMGSLLPKHPFKDTK